MTAQLGMLRQESRPRLMPKTSSERVAKTQWVKELSQRGPLGPMPQLRLSLDSGAFSIFSQVFSGINKKRTATNAYGEEIRYSKSPYYVGDAGVARRFLRTTSPNDYSYVESKLFREYLERYIDFLRKTGDVFGFYVTLDVIGNAELTWEVQKEIEQSGLEPIPVLHYGEDFQWMEMYVKKGYPYIGVAGFAQRAINRKELVRYADQIFARIPHSKKGRPERKTHGFAVNNLPYLLRYPFYSADATTWGVNARLGKVQIPQPIFETTKSGTKRIRWRYLHDGMRVTFSQKALAAAEAGTRKSDHLVYLSKAMQQVVLAYLEETLGYVPHSDDLAEDYTLRSLLNLLYFRKMEEELKAYYAEKFDYPEGGNIFNAGASPDLAAMMPGMKELGQDRINWFPTYWDQVQLGSLLLYRHLTENRHKDGTTKIPDKFLPSVERRWIRPRQLSFLRARGRDLHSRLEQEDRI